MLGDTPTSSVNRVLKVPSDEHPRLSRFVVGVFAMMQRNSMRVPEFYKLPRDQVVEIGREIAL